MSIKMKKVIIFLLLIAAIGASAQTAATKIKSKSALADSIWLNRGAIEVSPIQTGNGSDTIRSIDYKFHSNRDTLSSMTIEINSYNKNGGLLATDFITVPQTLYSRWKALITPLDA